MCSKLVHTAVLIIIFYSQIEARIILARLLQKFQFSLPADFKLEMELQATLQPKGLVPCTLMLIQED